MAIYVPRVLICGDVKEFIKKIGDKPVEIVGQIKLKNNGDDVKLSLGEQSLTGADIKSLLDGTADYLIFNNAFDYGRYFEKFPRNTQVISLEVFIKKVYSGSFPFNTLLMLNKLLSHKKFGRVLDFDAFFVKSNFYTQSYFNIKVEGIIENFYPIIENIYEKIYHSFDECKFHHFDAIILTKERTSEEFIDVVINTEALTENIWVFVRKNSELETWLVANGNIFAKIEYCNTVNGAWCHIKKNVPPVDVGVYVVTHKDAKLSTLPDGYKFIHAGHALAKNDFGYAGDDDTGDNISRLNPFLDEVTALYWIWKNTKHTHTGFVHYRRFFTNTTNQKTFSAKKILSVKDILKILSEYDFIVQKEDKSEVTLREQVLLSVGQPDLVQVCERIIRNHLARTQPDYLDVFDDVINDITLFPCGMHITRRNIFNAYCEWLFSFMLDATKDVRDKLKIDSKSLGEMPHQYSRVMGHFAERMMTIWLVKNHLRIKTLPIMFRKDV